MTTLRGALACLLAVAFADGAAAQERWTAGFRQGFAFATLGGAQGRLLQLSCDTSGPKPGRGAATIELRAPRAAIGAVPPRIETVVLAGGQTIRFVAAASSAPARDAAPGSARRRNGETLVETRASESDVAVTLSYDADGSAEAAEPLAALAAAIAREPREIVLRAPQLQLEARLSSRQAARAMRGFEKGCQDALPPPDDEIQWDWQQGLDRIGDQPQATLVAAADGLEGARLMLRCRSGTLQAVLSGWPRGGPSGLDVALAAVVSTAQGDSAQSLWRGARSGDEWIIEDDAAARFIAALWRGARAALSFSPEARATFAIEGTPLATRKLIESCPTPLLPPRD